jgi:hypothetical protein
LATASVAIREHRCGTLDTLVPRPLSEKGVRKEDYVRSSIVQSSPSCKSDNAFLAVDDVAALKNAADKLSPDIIRERLDYGTFILGPLTPATPTPKHSAESRRRTTSSPRSSVSAAAPSTCTPRLDRDIRMRTLCRDPGSVRHPSAGSCRALPLCCAGAPLAMAW